MSSESSVIKRRIGSLKFTDDVVVDLSSDQVPPQPVPDLSSYLDKRTGGNISGDVSVDGSSLSVLLGDIV